MENNVTRIKPSTIETIDMSIFKLIDEEFNLHTKTNNGFKKVPVLWMSPERAHNSKNKEVRDSVGKLKLPLISIERTSLSKDPSFKGAFQANVPNNNVGDRGYRKHQRLVSRRISQKTTRKFASVESSNAVNQENYPTDNKKVVYEEVYAPIPVWVTVEYTIKLRTEYQQQMNDLITPFITIAGNINAILSEYDGHQYEVFIDGSYNYSNNSNNLGEDERAFDTTITLKVLGYLLGDGVNEEVPEVVVKETIVEVKLIRERSIVGDSKPWENDDDGFRDF